MRRQEQKIVREYLKIKGVFKLGYNECYLNWMLETIFFFNKSCREKEIWDLNKVNEKELLPVHRWTSNKRNLDVLWPETRMGPT